MRIHILAFIRDGTHTARQPNRDDRLYGTGLVGNIEERETLKAIFRVLRIFTLKAK